MVAKLQTPDAREALPFCARRRAADCHYKSLKLRNRVEADETSVGQHTDVDVPHFEAEDFNFIKGAFMSIDRWVPSVA